MTLPPYLWHVKRYLDMTHSTQVVNLIRLNVGNDGNKIGSIAQVTVVQK